jgi:hypothetical protein
VWRHAFARARWLLVAAAIAPILLAFWIQKKHWINIPIWDEWDTPGQALLQYAQKALTWADLFAQHNESRKVVPRLIHIAIASVAGWDVRQGMVLTFLCACAASACTLAFLRRRQNHSFFHVLIPWFLINLFLFAPSQYENFLSGFVFEIFLPFLCLFGCCAINLSGRSLPTKVLCNSLLAVVSTYSFAHGMLLWVFGAPIPFREEGLQRTARFFICYALYGAVGLIAIAYYFIGYHRPEIAPPSARLNQFPLVLEFIVVWLGAVVRSPFVNARLCGTLVSLIIIATLAGAFTVLRKNRERWTAYYPWLLLLTFALSSGALTAIGRVNIGIDNVFNTWLDGFSGMRYNASSVFSYVAVIGLAFNLYEDRIRLQPLWHSRFLFGMTVCYTLLGVAWIQMFADESTRVKLFQANRKRARTATIWANALPENPELVAAYPYPDGFAERIEAMRAAGVLKLPRVSDSLREKIAKAPVVAGDGAGFLDVAELRGAGHCRLAGWARSLLKQGEADYVALGWQEPDNSFHPLSAVRTGIVRPDVAEIFGQPLRKAGFDAEIDISKLPAGAVTIKAWAIDWEAQQAFPLEGAIRLELPPR